MRPISEIADLVRDRRAQLRLSQRRAATLADISSTTWQSFEKHRKPVSEMTITGMADALRWPTDWYQRLADGEDPGGFEEAPPNGDESEPPPWDLLLAQMEAVTQTLERLADLVEQRRELD